MNIAKISSKTIDRFKITWEQREGTLEVKVPLPKFSSTPKNISITLLKEDGSILRCPGGNIWEVIYSKKNKEFKVELIGIDNLFQGIVEFEFDIITKVKS